MKKFIYTFFALTFIAFVSKAQIPNFSFENWTSMGSYENPDNWGTMNNTTAAEGIYTATKGTPGNPGSAYLMLTSLTTPPGILNAVAVCGVLDPVTMKPISGFAFNLRPQSLTGKWQHMIFGSSQGGIYVLLTKWNTNFSKRDTIAYAINILSGMAMLWEDFSINLTYQSGDFPDSCIIFLKASGSNPANGDYLWLDDLAFAGSVAGIENNTSNRDYIPLFPNPARDELIIDTDIDNTECTLSVYNVNGQELIKQNVKGRKNKIDIKSLAKGVYFVKIYSSNKCFSINKFVKE